MARARTPKTPEDNVVNIENFLARKRQPQTTQRPNPLVGFHEAPYKTYHAVRHVLSHLSGSPSTAGLTLLIRKSGEDRSRVIKSADGRPRFAVDLSRFEGETVTADLDLQKVGIAERLREPLDRHHVALHIARHVLENGPAMIVDRGLPIPKVGDITFRVNNAEEWQDITRWRAASGLSIEAVAPRRPELQSEIATYLKDVLRWRMQYHNNITEMGALLGTEVPVDEIGSSNYLIGICNPLDKFGLSRVLPRSSENNDGTVT